MQTLDQFTHLITCAFSVDNGIVTEVITRGRQKVEGQV